VGLRAYLTLQTQRKLSIDELKQIKINYRIIVSSGRGDFANFTLVRASLFHVTSRGSSAIFTPSRTR